MNFRALSVIEPYGHFISIGKKTIEVRKWRPDDVLPITNLVIVENAIKLSSTIQPYDPDGYVVAMVDVTNIRNWKEKDLDSSCSTSFEAGWLAWELENIRKVVYPLKVPARLRIYDINLDTNLLEIETLR
jgi:hypothetical protein